MTSLLRPVLRRATQGQFATVRVWRRLRQRVFIARVTAQAMWVHGKVKFELAPDLIIGRNIRVVVWSGTDTTFRIGPKSRLGDNLTIHMRGGSFYGGIRTDLRTNVSVNIEGDITLDGENTVSFGSVLHCGEKIHLGYAAIMAEYTTVADSTHFHTTADEPVGENVKFAGVEIGRNSFLAPHVSVGRGVTIGPWTVIGPSSAVAKDIPAGVFASGLPAQVVRSLDHPWMADVEAGVPGAPDPETPAWRKHTE
jgi:acetyltransferase-like isoleucine patch superfamily enzyme